MNAVSAVQKMLGRTSSLSKNMASSRTSSYGVSDHVSMEEELPHPARNLTVSRVVIMVLILLLALTWPKCRDWKLCMFRVRLGYELLQMVTVSLSRLSLGKEQREAASRIFFLCVYVLENWR